MPLVEVYKHNYVLLSGRWQKLLPCGRRIFFLQRKGFDYLYVNTLC